MRTCFGCRTFLFLQAPFLPSAYEGNFLWNNLLVAVVAVRIFSNHFLWSHTGSSCLFTCVCVCACAAVPPVHPAAVPAPLAGDLLRREDDEEGPVVQVCGGPDSDHREVEVCWS